LGKVGHVPKGAITSEIKHAIKLKTSPARLAQLLQPSLAFCFSCKLKQNDGALVLSFIACCDRSLMPVDRRPTGQTAVTGTSDPCYLFTELYASEHLCNIRSTLSNWNLCTVLHLPVYEIVRIKYELTSDTAASSLARLKCHMAVYTAVYRAGWRPKPTWLGQWL